MNDGMRDVVSTGDEKLMKCSKKNAMIMKLIMILKETNAQESESK